MGERLIDERRLRTAPHDKREVKALALEGTDVDCSDPSQPALVGSRDAGAANSGIDRRTSRQQGHRLRRTAVVAQRGQTRTYHADDVAVRSVDQSARAAGTDQIMRPGNEAEDVAGARIIGIARDDCVGDQECAANSPTVATAGIIKSFPTLASITSNPPFPSTFASWSYRGGSAQPATTAHRAATSSTEAIRAMGRRRRLLRISLPVWMPW